MAAKSPLARIQSAKKASKTQARNNSRPHVIKDKDKNPKK